MTATAALWSIFGIVLFSLLWLGWLAIERAKYRRRPGAESTLLKEYPVLWRYQCDEPGDAKASLDAYFSLREEAVEWLNHHDIFCVSRVDNENATIYFKLDWTIYRERFPCKWCAMKQGTADGIFGGSFYTPPMIRSEAIKFVVSTGNGRFLRDTDDQHKIIYYSNRSND